MHALFNLFLDICLFRKGPQDVPSSWTLLKLTLAAYGISSLMVLLVNVEPAIAFFQILVDLSLLGGMTYGVLNLLGYEMRFVQTLTALAGTGTLLGLIAWPLVIWMAQEAAVEGGMGLSSLLFLLLLGWSIAVMAHVLHHALSTSRPMGLLYTLGYLVVSIVVAGWLFPQG